MISVLCGVKIVDVLLGFIFYIKNIVDFCNYEVEGQ